MGIATQHHQKFDHLESKRAWKRKYFKKSGSLATPQNPISNKEYVGEFPDIYQKVHPPSGFNENKLKLNLVKKQSSLLAKKMAKKNSLIAQKMIRKQSILNSAMVGASSVPRQVTYK